MNLVTEGIQVGDSPEASLEKVKNSSGIYSNRKDAHAIREKLFKIVSDTEYWNTFACFLHGQCSKQSFDDVMQNCLQTREAKLLHNELIRSILYNAHFSMRPPPGVEVPKPVVPAAVKKAQPPSNNPKNATFMTYTAADLRHLPSINQLSLRIGVLLNSMHLNVESKATGLLFSELKKFIMTLLENSSALLTYRGSSEQGELKITSAQVLHVLTNQQKFASIVSPSVLTKYSTTLQ